MDTINLSEENENLIRNHIQPFVKSLIDKNAFANIKAELEIHCGDSTCKMNMLQEKECSTKFTTSVIIEVLNQNNNTIFKKVYSGCNGRLVLSDDHTTTHKYNRLSDYISTSADYIKTEEDKMDDIVSNVRENTK